MKPGSPPSSRGLRGRDGAAAAVGAPLVALLCLAATGCILEAARRDGARCSETGSCPPGQQCSSDGQCLYRCPDRNCRDRECGCASVDRKDDQPGAGWTCLDDGLCHFKCQDQDPSSGGGFCSDYMNCDPSSGLCRPACSSPEQCANGASCVPLPGGDPGGTPKGSLPPNFCVGSGGTGDGGTGDGGTVGGYRSDLYDTVAEPVALATDQVTTDALLDLVVVTRTNESAFVFLGQDDGHFLPHGQNVLGSFPYWVGLGRFNHDMGLDLVFLHETDTRLDVRLGAGDGSMSYQWQSGTLPVAPSAAIVGRFNDDSLDDLATIAQSSSQLVVAIADGTGQLVIGAPLATAARPVALAAADVTDDGVQDLVIVSQGDAGLQAWLAKGDGTFGAGPSLAPVAGPSGGTPTAVVAGFFDDGPAIDFAVSFTGHGVDAIKLVLNWPGAGFSGGGIPDALEYGPLVTGDFDGDGRTDLGALNLRGDGKSDFVVFRHQGAGHFGPAQRYALAGQAAAVVAGRFNGDACDDVAVVLPALHQTQVLVSTRCPPGP